MLFRLKPYNCSLCQFGLILIQLRREKLFKVNMWKENLVNSTLSTVFYIMYVFNNLQIHYEPTELYDEEHG